MKIKIPIITAPLRSIPETNQVPDSPARPAQTGTPRQTKFQRFEQLVRDLMQTHEQWAALITRMHDEHDMDFPTISWMIGEPVNAVRRHYQHVKESQQPIALISL